jgi:hypothetical protein
MEVAIVGRKHTVEFDLAKIPRTVLGRRAGTPYRPRMVKPSCSAKSSKSFTFLVASGRS